jgi:RNA polymerase sigma factor (TIGR02999 family)
MADDPAVEGGGGDVTEWLLAWTAGDATALEKVIPQIHDYLCRMARGHLRREREGHTLETSGLVNEAFLRLVDQRRVSWRDRAHFFAIASQMMRRVLTDHARRRVSEKRGGVEERLSLQDLEAPSLARPERLVALDEALCALEGRDQDSAKIVELRFFGGMNREEIAESLGVSSATVTRRWSLARAWLFRYLEHGISQEL